mmetsp:Transcript_82204/g.156172  ORF Transcript_82204/g.156172 Transcript_82204/m.156172 type:complete len:370 (+) Transcript_82204:1680-2789(+)
MRSRRVPSIDGERSKIKTTSKFECDAATIDGGSHKAATAVPSDGCCSRKSSGLASVATANRNSNTTSCRMSERSCAAPAWSAPASTVLRPVPCDGEAMSTNRGAAEEVEALQISAEPPLAAAPGSSLQLPVSDFSAATATSTASTDTLSCPDRCVDFLRAPDGSCKFNFVTAPCLSFGVAFISCTYSSRTFRLALGGMRPRARRNVPGFPALALSLTPLQDVLGQDGTVCLMRTSPNIAWAAAASLPEISAQKPRSVAPPGTERASEASSIGYCASFVKVSLIMTCASVPTSSTRAEYEESGALQPWSKANLCSPEDGSQWPETDARTCHQGETAAARLTATPPTRRLRLAIRMCALPNLRLAHPCHYM